MPPRHSVLVLLVIGTVLGVMSLPRVPEPASYHCLADARSWLGVPNTLNVLSNLPFAVVGILGFAATFGPVAAQSDRFLSPWERWPYAALFAGAALTSVGSAYYHLAPDNARLVWDRLPMTLGFMGLLTAMLSERINIATARRLFVPLLAVGAFSVVYWFWTERHGVGDLRLYGLVQFGSIFVIVLLLLLYRASYTGVGYLVGGIVAYAVAMGFDRTDRQVFAIGHVVSGHTLKHLIAAAAVGCLVAMLRVRSPVNRLAQLSPPNGSG
jgi:predicted membrane channel-forming protein YqfA (hemolysin III family)